ncbi:MAG: B12-binding domain-containing radical SAM protein, partial [Endomicrobiales bacterium]
YCSETLRPRGAFSKERFLDDVKTLIDNGAKVIRIGDSSFHFSPHFKEICEAIRVLNREKRTELYANIYPEHITEEVARTLKECNFTLIEIGFQSNNARALASVYRKQVDREKFTRGIRILKDQGIDCMVEIIVGLPNDSLDDLKRTLGFLRESGITVFSPALLRVVPGTSLWRDAQKYGIKHNMLPGYEIEEADYISKDELKTAERLVGGYGIPSSLGSFASYCAGSPGEKKGGKFRHDRLVNKVVIEIDPKKQTESGLRETGEKISRIVDRNFTVWAKMGDIAKDGKLLRSFIAPVAERNPFLIWHIVLEMGKTGDTGSIASLIEDIGTKEKMIMYLTKAVALYCVLDWKKLGCEKEWVRQLSTLAPCYWGALLKDGKSWKKDME